MNLPKIECLAPNQNVLTHENGRTFQSYGTNIAHVANDGSVTLDQKKWDYSNTTGKYRNEFLGEKKADTQRKIQSGEYKLANLN